LLAHNYFLANRVAAGAERAYYKFLAITKSPA